MSGLPSPLDQLRFAMDELERIKPSILVSPFDYDEISAALAAHPLRERVNLIKSPVVPAGRLYWAPARPRPNLPEAQQVEITGG